jgi:hypothetical protein
MKAAQATLSVCQNQRLSRRVVKAHPSLETLDNCWSIFMSPGTSRGKPRAAALSCQIEIQAMRADEFESDARRPNP